jgi:uncharacterized protein YegL
MTSKRFDPSRFTAGKSKTLPVFLLLDVSGSMNEIISDSFERTGQTVVEDGQTWEIVKGGVSRIEVLNQAVKEMITAFAREEQLDREILVSIITFGAAVSVHLSPTKASGVSWTPLTASGETPLGEAIATAKRLIEDKETTPTRAYRPVVVVVSDGKPTDGWEASLESFVGAGRSSKCDRMALSIGAGADEAMLRKFLAGTANPLFHAVDATQILDAFQRVTMSVTVRSRSRDPNQVPRFVDGAPVLAAPAEGPAGASSPETTGSDDEDGYW